MAIVCNLNNPQFNTAERLLLASYVCVSHFATNAVVFPWTCFFAAPLV